MYLGLGLRLASGTVAGFDADAAAYFDRAGVTDATAKSQINAFVNGIKDLGLWSSIVSWPLRSSQNAGTGTTAYSLGGLGIYNGTLANSPAWGVDGVTFSPTNSCMQIGYTLASGSHTILAGALNSAIVNNSQIFRVSNSDNNFHFWQRRNATSPTLFSPNTDLSGYINGAITNTAIASAYNTFGATTSRTFGTGTSSGTPSFFGDTANNQQWGDIGSFASIFNLALTTPQMLSLHNLLKTTLGTGLGLP
jgi:hypothetical protein